MPLPITTFRDPASRSTRLVSIPRCDQPVLSILMVLYRGGSLALDALASVRDLTDVPYEVIVVDNASPDASGALVRMATSGVHFIGLPTNLGFGPAMNRAASQARGAFLCFLNPDVIVEPGWASPLVTAASRPGAVGATPLLLNPDGSVQEAGGAIDGLGHTHAVGAGEWTLGDSSSTPRVIDYSSAAALVVRTEAFHAVGGFDSRYRLAYFEDADLAFSLAHAGGRLWFEPTSRVFHLRGGTAVGRTALDLGHENHARFVDKWRAELLARPCDVTVEANRLELRDWRTGDEALDASSTGF